MQRTVIPDHQRMLIHEANASISAYRAEELGGYFKTHSSAVS